MDYRFIKNPIILGIFAAVLTYLYFYWDAEQKRKKNPEIQQTKISLVTPGIVGALVWFVASTYLDSTNQIQESVTPAIEALATKPALENGPKKVFQLVDSEGSVGSHSVHLLTKNKIKLPPTDVFIDLAKF